MSAGDPSQTSWLRVWRFAVVSSTYRCGFQLFMICAKSKLPRRTTLENPDPARPACRAGSKEPQTTADTDPTAPTWCLCSVVRLHKHQSCTSPLSTRQHTMEPASHNTVWASILAFVCILVVLGLLLWCVLLPHNLLPFSAVGDTHGADAGPEAHALLIFTLFSPAQPVTTSPHAIPALSHRRIAVCVCGGLLLCSAASPLCWHGCGA